MSQHFELSSITAVEMYFTLLSLIVVLPMQSYLNGKLINAIGDLEQIDVVRKYIPALFNIKYHQSVNCLSPRRHLLIGFPH
jgi:hypothetical protein